MILEKIKALMVLKEMSNSELAEKSEYSRTYVYDALNRGQSTALATIDRLLEAMEVEVSIEYNNKVNVGKLSEITLELLKEYRELNGLSLTVLGKELELDPSTVSKILSGSRKTSSNIADRLIEASGAKLKFRI